MQKSDNKDDICVVISLYNEEDVIEDCIQSAFKLTHNVIVVDTESIDNTVNIAKKIGVSVYSFPRSDIIEPSRNFAIKCAKTRWVYILDADERISDELVKEIQGAIIRDTFTHYSGPRLNIFAQKWPLKHGGWWPDPVIRLLRKDAFEEWPSQIHSSPKIKGEMGYLKSPLLHLSQGNMSEMVEKTVRFEDKESTLLRDAGKSVTTLTFFRKYIAEFYRRAIRDRGLLDGPSGLIASMYQAYSKTITYLMLYEKNSS